MVRLDAARGRPVAHDRPGHGEGEHVERDGLHVVLVLRETDAGARHGVATDGLSGGVGRG